jgi:flagellar biosynthesis protein FlhG
MTEKKDRALTERPKNRSERAQIITIAGGKGGIGKTFLATNFGVALKNNGYRVLIFDADINLSNVYLLLNVDFNRSFQEFLYGNIPIHDVIQKGVGGVDVLYAGEELERIFSLSEEAFNAIADGLSKIENEYDFIVIDTQAGLTELNQKLLLLSDRIILITTPEITALVDLYKVIKVAAYGKKGLHFEIIVNRVQNAEHATRVYKKISQTVSQFGIKSSLSLLGFIVEDQKRVIESIQKRIPIILLHQKGSVAECLRIITNSFLGRSRPKRKFPFFFSLLER